MRRAIGGWAAWVGVLAWVGGATAQPPSLALSSDARPPAHLFAVRVDVVEAIERVSALEVDAVLRPAHALWGVVGWVFPQGGGPRVALGYRLRPLARGLEGPLLGVDLGVRPVGGGQGHRTGLELGLEVGYDAVFRGLAVGVAVGLRVRHALGSGGGHRGVTLAPRVALRVGRAFR